MSEKELYQAVLGQAYKDLYDKKERDDTYIWFMSDCKSDKTSISFIDLCIITDENINKARDKATEIYRGKVPYAQFKNSIKEAIKESSVVKVPKHTTTGIHHLYEIHDSGAYGATL